jgi:hypothetical protein
MSISTAIKLQIMKRVQNLPSVQETYGHHEMNPKGWPAVFVSMGDMNGEFISNAENARLYGFRCTVVFPITQNFPGVPSGTNRLEYAEQLIAQVVDEIINAIDTNFELDGNPVLFVGAADATWGEASMEIGIVKAVEVTLTVRTDYVVS